MKQGLMVSKLRHVFGRDISLMCTRVVAIITVTIKGLLLCWRDDFKLFLYSNGC